MSRTQILLLCGGLVLALPASAWSQTGNPALQAPTGNPQLVDPSSTMPNPSGLGVAPPANPMDQQPATVQPPPGIQRPSYAEPPQPGCTPPNCGTPTIMTPP